MTLFSEYPYQNFSDYNLDWIIHTVKNYMKLVDDLSEWKDQHELEYKELKELYDQIVSGNFPDSVKMAFDAWMRKNAINIVGELVKNVFFGLTDSGYFVAYIPESWEDIIFNTTGFDTDYFGFNYGHLVLSY